MSAKLKSVAQRFFSRTAALAWILVILTALFSGVVQADKIYRTVDENGNVVFSDLPPANKQSSSDAPQKSETKQAEIEVEPVNTYESAVATPRQEYSGESKPSTRAAYYQVLDIMQPSPDESLRDNAGNVTIIAAVQPDMRSDHSLQLVMDGTESGASAEGNSISLGNVDRGTHTISLRIVDRGGNVLIESDPVTFHLQRYSIQHNANQG